MIFVQNLTVEYPGKTLFDNISFVINPKDRIGLVGKNGVGKTSMMNIVAGYIKPSSGQVKYAEDKVVGYLPQEIKINSQKNIFDETKTAFGKVIQYQEEVDSIVKQLEERQDYESEAYAELINQMSEKQEQINLLGGNDMDGEVEKTLRGLGFKDSDFKRPISEFSGGWQMRVELAKLLLIQPDLLLLDEPTNHLDIESIIWLENFLKNYPGAIMMVSHDKMFLDNITNRTVEIVFGKIYDYKVSYNKFFQLREERLEQQMAAYKNQQKHIAQQEEFINRFKAKASKAKQAQSISKRLDKLDRIEMDELDTSSIRLNFPPAPRSGETVVKAHQTSKSYGELEVLKDVRFEIKRGEKIAFVGKNGQGKSTMIKMIMGLENYIGELTLGHNVHAGYYAQIQEKTLNENDTVLQTIEKKATGDMAQISKIRSILGAFLFQSEDDISKKVKVLSGGEKSRLALAILLLEKYNLLILDEPTNHLDIASKEVLKQALIDFSGTIILVSHDRDFLQGLASRTFEFKDKQVREHLGDIDDFLAHYEVASFRDFEQQKEVIKTSLPKKESENSYEQQKEQKKKIKKIKNAITNTEKEISELEAQIKTLEVKLQDPDFFKNDPNAQQEVEKYGEIKHQLERKMIDWEKLSEELILLEDE